MNVRLALESEAIRIIAAKGWMSPEQEQELRRIQDVMDEHVKNKDFRQQYLSDDEFHQTLVEACGSPRIISFLDRMRLQMLRARWLNVTMPQRQEETIEEHEAFLAAFLGHDLENSLRLMREHLSHSIEAFREMLEDPGGEMPEGPAAFSSINALMSKKNTKIRAGGAGLSLTQKQALWYYKQAKGAKPLIFLLGAKQLPAGSGRSSDNQLLLGGENRG